MKFFKKSEFWFSIFILITIFIYRLPYSFASVVDYDESCYFVAAQNMLNGNMLYRDIFDFKGPVIPSLLALAIKVVGQNPFALHIFTTFYLFVNMAYVALISRRLFPNKSYLIAAFIYGAFFSNQLGGISSNGELFMMLPVTIAAFHFIRYVQDKRTLDVFWCGFFSSIAIMTKQTAFFSVLAVFLGWICVEAKSFPGPKALVKKALLYLAGGLTPFLFFIIYFAINKALPDFLESCFFLGSQYVDSTPLKEAFWKFGDFMFKVSVVDMVTIINYASLLFCLLVYREMAKPQRRIFDLLMLFMVCSFVGVFWGRNMFGHYYLQMALVFSLLPALALSLLNLSSIQIKRMLIASLIIFWTTIDAYQVYSSVNRYKLSKNDLNVVVARYIKERTSPKDTIFVLSGHPVLYFLADRFSPTKYYYWILYEERWIKIPHLKEITLEAFMKNKPKYFIADINSRGKIPFLEVFMQEYYNPEVVIGTYVIAKVKE